jgi:thymidylate synthase (FAD)
MSEAINKIIERVPEARFVYVGGPRYHGQFRLIIDGEYYWVRYVNSFVVTPEEMLTLAMFEQMAENDRSKSIENRLNQVAEPRDIAKEAMKSTRITSEDLAFTINCTGTNFGPLTAAMRTAITRKTGKMESIKVLDEGYVSFVEGWGSDESIIEAARMSTGKGFNGWGTEDNPGDERLLAFLYNNKHATPFEMGGVVIEVKAPIFVFREWHRHRTQSYNEMSARYIPLPDENYVPSLDRLMVGANTATTNKQAQGNGTTLTEAAAEGWAYELEALYHEAQRVYERGIAIGVPKELARLPVPVARYSRMRASANLRNWLAFLTLRQAPQAQWEIRQYADAVGQIVADRFPRTWELFTKGKELVTSK